MRTAFTLLMLAWAAMVLGQSSRPVFQASMAGPQRLSVIKSVVHFESFDEASFLPAYERYVKETQKATLNYYRTLKVLANVGALDAPQDANDAGTSMLLRRSEQIQRWKVYHQDIASSVNGIASLEFLQTEILMDLMESASIYEKTRWKDYRFSGAGLQPEQYREIKKNVLFRAIGVGAAEQERFWSLYQQYEKEIDDAIGIDYDMISMFAVQPADFTPALAKRLGVDLVDLLSRENSVKEKYFNRISGELNPKLAAGFLAWEDYYSVLNKMYAWADAP